MKLQLLIPQYNETEEIIKPMLDSLVVQQCVNFNDFGVIIVNDGSEVKLSEDFLKKYPYQIDYYQAPHRGVSATRNTCLDYATADYIMFCDADDMFYNACGLYLIFHEIDDNGGFDTLVSCFIEEARLVNGKSVYVNHNNDHTFVHGKVHRRQYLIDNGIRWNEKLTIHEDSYFNILTWDLTQIHKYLETSFYLWKFREGSVCRSDPQYILKTYPLLLDSIDSVIDVYLSKNMESLAIMQTIYNVIKTYYILNKPEWRKIENIEYMAKLEKRVYDFYFKRQSLWSKATPETILNITNELRTKIIKEGMLMEELTFNQWLDKIIKSYQHIN